jgi:peptidoglycan/LPS O-acetylase OafA/YrhL
MLLPHSERSVIQNDLAYYLTYTSNFNVYNTHRWDEILCHLWSLAVEEQFYLIWPFVILLTNKKYLVHAICLFMAIGFLSQLFVSTEFDIVLPFQCFDALGIGALLSWINLNKPEYLRKALQVFSALIILAFIYYFIALFAGRSVFIPDSTPSFAAAWLITFVLLRERKSEAKNIWVLNNRFLMLIGRISYGLYLYHLLIPYFTYRVMKRLDIYDSLRAAIPAPYFKSLINIGNFALLILIAWLSWNYIEKPILNLRKYFQKKTEPTPGLALPGKRVIA